MANIIPMGVGTNTQNVNVNLTESGAKDIVWRQIGKQFDGKNVRVEEAISEIGADFNVSKQPLIRVPQDIYDAIKNGTPIDTLNLSTANLISSHCATVRDDHDFTLGVVGNGYGVVQNAKAFEFIDFIKEVSGEEPIVETAGLLGNGERIFVTCKLGADSYLNPNDAVKNYVVFTNAHDGSGSVMAFFSPTRVICSNSLLFAIKHCPNKVVFKHTKNVGMRLDWEREENRKKALEVFSKSVKFSEKWVDEMLKLRSQKVDENFKKDFVARMYLSDAGFKLYQQNNRNWDSVDEISTRSKNQANALIDSIEYGIGQKENRGTKLWLLNGLTTHIQNVQTWKDAETQFNSVIMGGTEGKRIQKAYDLLIAA